MKVRGEADDKEKVTWLRRCIDGEGLDKNSGREMKNESERRNGEERESYLTKELYTGVKGKVQREKTT